MTVEIVKDTFLIRVGLELPDPNQAAAIVNAVVHSYLEYNFEHQRSGNATLRASLADQLKKYKNEISEKLSEVEERLRDSPHRRPSYTRQERIRQRG